MKPSDTERLCFESSEKPYELLDWHISSEGLRFLNNEFEICGVEFKCLGILDRGDCFAVDFYTESCPSSLNALTPVRISVNGGRDKLDIMKKCISCKPKKQERLPGDLVLLCRTYDIDISNIEMLERIEIHKPKELKVEELTVTFLWEKDFCLPSDYKACKNYEDNSCNEVNAAGADNGAYGSMLNDIESKPLGCGVTLLKSGQECRDEFIKCRLI